LDKNQNKSKQQCDLLMATLFSDKPMAVAASSLAFIIAVRAKEAGAHPGTANKRITGI
jgi:hypothetical protein